MAPTPPGAYPVPAYPGPYGGAPPPRSPRPTRPELATPAFPAPTPPPYSPIGDPGPAPFPFPAPPPAADWGGSGPFLSPPEPTERYGNASPFPLPGAPTPFPLPAASGPFGAPAASGPFPGAPGSGPFGAPAASGPFPGGFPGAPPPAALGGNRPEWPPAVPSADRDARPRTRVDDASQQNKPVKRTAMRRAARGSDRSLYLIAGAGGGALLLVVGLLVGVGAFSSNPEAGPGTSEVLTGSPAPDGAASDKALLEEAQRFATEHPDDIAGQASRYHDLAEKARDPEIAKKAAKLAEEARARLDEAARQETDKLLERARDAERRKDYDVACAILDRPPAIVARDDKLAAELARERKRLGHERGLARARTAIASRDGVTALAELRDLLECGDLAVERDAQGLKVEAERILAQGGGGGPGGGLGGGPMGRPGGGVGERPVSGGGPGGGGPGGGSAPPPQREPTRDEWLAQLQQILHLSADEFGKQRDAAKETQEKLEAEWKDAKVLNEVQLRDDGKNLKGVKVQARIDMCPAGRMAVDDPSPYIVFNVPEQSRLELGALPVEPLPSRVALRIFARIPAPSTAPDLGLAKLHLGINSAPFGDLSIFSDSKPVTLLVELTQSWQKGSKNTLVLTLAGTGISPAGVSKIQVVGLP